MPTIRRRAKARRVVRTRDLAWGEDSWLKADEYRDPAPPKLGRPFALQSKQAALDFYREHREAFLTDLGAGDTCTEPDRRLYHLVGERPWMWWELESPEPRDPKIEQAEQLHRIGELRDDEVEAYTNEDGEIEF